MSRAQSGGNAANQDALKDNNLREHMTFHKLKRNWDGQLLSIGDVVELGEFENLSLM